LSVVEFGAKIGKLGALLGVLVFAVLTLAVYVPCTVVDALTSPRIGIETL